MRKLLLVLLILSVRCEAQNFELGLNAGCNFHFKPVNNIYTTQDKAIAGYAVGFKADLLLSEFQVGVGVDVENFSQYNYLMPDYTTKVYNYLAKPLITPYAFLNKTFAVSQGYLYAGLMGGPAIARIGINSWQYNNGPYGNPTGYTTAYYSASGYMGGLQGGGVFHLNKVCALNFEAGLRYCNYNYKSPTTKLEDPYHYRVFYIPLTLGLRYLI